MKAPFRKESRRCYIYSTFPLPATQYARTKTAPTNRTDVQNLCHPHRAMTKKGRRRRRRWVPRASWAAGRNPRCSYPPLVHGIGRGGVRAGRTVPCVIPFVAVPFVIFLVRIISYLRGTGLGGGQRGACNVPRYHRADSGRESRTKCTPP